MQPIPEGYQDTFEIVITDEMTVNFEEMGRVHPVYATYWMVKHMELACRKIILPFLDAGEEGKGFLDIYCASAKSEISRLACS